MHSKLFFLFTIKKNATSRTYVNNEILKWEKPTKLYHGDIIGFGVTKKDSQSEEIKKNINNHNIYHLVKANEKPKPNEPIGLAIMVRPDNLRPIPRESIAT